MTCQRGSEGAPALHSFSVKPEIQKQGPCLLVPFLLRQEMDFSIATVVGDAKAFISLEINSDCVATDMARPHQQLQWPCLFSEFLTIGCSWWGLSECLTECRVAERCDHWQEARDDRRLTVGFRTQGTVTRKQYVEFSRTESGRIMQERAIWPETWPQGERLGSLLGILPCVGDPVLHRCACAYS